MARKVLCEQLGPEPRKHLSELLATLVPVASDKKHPMSVHANDLLSTICWYWTADGYNPKDGRVQRDALKYEFRRLHHTEEAKARWIKNRADGGKPYFGLRHEHAVPRDVLVRKVIEGKMEARAVHDLFARLCIGVIVTVEEDAKLLKKTMPEGWDGQDPFARYRKAQIRVLPPDAAAQ